MLTVSKSKLDQELQHDIDCNQILSCLKMHHIMASLPKWLLTPQKETSYCVLNMTIFKQFIGAFMGHIIRLNAGKEIKAFSELFINKNFEYTIVLFVSNKSLHSLHSNLRCLYKAVWSSYQDFMNNQSFIVFKELF